MPVRIADSLALEKTFQRLAEEWKKDCEFLSSSSAMVRHPAYQAIIELGEPVTPLLLRDLQKERTHWFEALKAITAEDPVLPADWGNISAMTSAWLEWGRSRNLI